MDSVAAGLAPGTLERRSGREGVTPVTAPLRLRGRCPVLWRAAGTVQVGTDPRWSVVLTDLSPEATRALAGLDGAADERALRTALHREGASAAEADSVVQHLIAAHLLVPADRGTSADEATWSLLRPAGDGSAVAARRARATVGVAGLGRLGAGIALGMAAGGVGTLVLEDAAAVSRLDAGTGLTTRDVGRPRSEAVARAAHDAAPGVRTRVGDATAADLVVTVEHHVADPVVAGRLADLGRPQLSVVVREASVLVGPLVRPGWTPCLRCVDLARADADPAWAVVAAQLVRAAPLPEETSLALLGAALAVAAALDHVDARPPRVEGASWSVALPDASPRLVTWDVHPECGCTGP